jgi:hypothetical protein
MSNNILSTFRLCCLATTSVLSQPAKLVRWMTNPPTKSPNVGEPEVVDDDAVVALLSATMAAYSYMRTG